MSPERTAPMPVASPTSPTAMTNTRTIASLDRISARKPVVVLKGGRTAAGAHAVSSHTGALAGSGRWGSWRRNFFRKGVMGDE